MAFIFSRGAKIAVIVSFVARSGDHCEHRMNASDRAVVPSLIEAGLLCKHKPSINKTHFLTTHTSIPPPLHHVRVFAHTLSAWSNRSLLPPRLSMHRRSYMNTSLAFPYNCRTFKAFPRRSRNFRNSPRRSRSWTRSWRSWKHGFRQSGPQPKSNPKLC